MPSASASGLPVIGPSGRMSGHAFLPLGAPKRVDVPADVGGVDAVTRQDGRTPNPVLHVCCPADGAARRIHPKYLLAERAHVHGVAVAADGDGARRGAAQVELPRQRLVWMDPPRTGGDPARSQRPACRWWPARPTATRRVAGTTACARSPVQVRRGCRCCWLRRSCRLQPAAEPPNDCAATNGAAHFVWPGGRVQAGQTVVRAGAADQQLAIRGQHGRRVEQLRSGLVRILPDFRAVAEAHGVDELTAGQIDPL